MQQGGQEVFVMNLALRLMLGYGIASMMYGTGTAWAQVSSSPTMSPALPPLSMPNVAGLFVAAALVVLLAATILVGIAYDLSRKREALAVSLESRISDSLLADPSLGSLPVAPTVSIPLWRGLARRHRDDGLGPAVTTSARRAGAGPARGDEERQDLSPRGPDHDRSC